MTSGRTGHGQGQPLKSVSLSHSLSQHPLLKLAAMQGSKMINMTLRIFIGCKVGVWYEQGETGVAWQGEHAWRLNDVKSVTGLEYDVKYGKGLFTLRKGLADMTINTHGVNQDKAKKFDFSYPTAFFGVYIFSGKGDDRIKGNVFKGVFDDATYAMASISLATMVLLTFLILKKEDTNPSIVLTILRIFGNVFTQSLPDSMIPRSLIGTVWILFVPAYNMLMCLMYSSIIISLLTVAIETNVINNLGDLNKTENENVRIFMNRQGFVPAYLKDAKMLTGFENRTDYINGTGDEEFVIKSILNGSHVLIGNFWYFRQIICRANKKADKEMATIQDFWKSIEPLFSSRRGNLMRKKYKYAANVDKGLMWFHAFGFWEIRDATFWYALDLRRNDGVWAPNQGKCKKHITAQTCKLVPKMDYKLRTKNIKTRVYDCL